MDKAVGLLCPCLTWRGHGCTRVLAVFLLYKNDRHGLCPKKKKKKRTRKRKKMKMMTEIHKRREMLFCSKRGPSVMVACGYGDFASCRR